MGGPELPADFDRRVGAEEALFAPRHFRQADATSLAILRVAWSHPSPGAPHRRTGGPARSLNAVTTRTTVAERARATTAGGDCGACG